MTQFLLPDLGEGLDEAEIVAWHVAPGDRVVEDQPLVSVETSKAVVEVPSPQSGTIGTLHGAPGDIVKVGDPLVDFVEAGADAAAPDPGSVVGRLPVADDTQQVAPKPDARVSSPSSVLAAPAVRRLARDRGVDLAGLTGSGPGGAITSADVEAAARAPTFAVEGEALSGTRRSMALAMARARDVVPATVSDDADVTSWTLATDGTVLLMQALAVAVRAEPALNAHFDGARGVRRLFAQVDCALAVDTPDGLFAPVIRDVAAQDAAGLRAAVDTLKTAARERTLTPEQLRGGTIALSNFGTIGGTFAALTVMPPQVAIVGAGRWREHLVPASDGGTAVRKLLPVSLTFDHRVVTGGEAARFLAAFVAALQAIQEPAA